MSKRREPSATELENDPSLRWCDYRYGEALISDGHERRVRFVARTDDGRLKLADLVLSPIEGDFDPMTVRRPPVRVSVLSAEDKYSIAATATAMYGSRNLKGGRT